MHCPRKNNPLIDYFNRPPPKRLYVHDAHDEDDMDDRTVLSFPSHLQKVSERDAIVEVERIFRLAQVELVSLVAHTE